MKPKYFEKMLLQRIILSTFLFAILLPVAKSAHVVILCPTSPWSHKSLFVPVISALSSRGHNVTVVSAWETKVSESAQNNVRDIIPQKGFTLFPGINMFELRKLGVLGGMSQDFNYYYETCHKVYKNKEFRNLENVKIDLILYDPLLNDCMMGFIYKSGAPFVSFSTAPPMNYFTSFLGNRLPPSFVQNPYLAFTHDMTFFQRFVNTVFDCIINVRMDMFLWEFEKVYKEYYGDLDDSGETFPGIKEIEGNVSFILSNSHFALTFPRPTTPDVVEIGGIHCRPGRPLPKDLEDFVNGGNHGFILFSLGSIVRPHEMPDETRDIFLKVFSKLKQRVLWKWDDDSVKNLPPNVKISKWIPQQDLLAHKNIKLFITHGGLLSTQEAIYHSVPMLGVPVFADQDLNIGKAELAGIAFSIEILSVTENELETKIQNLLHDEQTRSRIKKLSSIFRDQLETPLERAVYWLEYLIRHKGAPHLRSAARNLNFFQYHSLDVAAALIVLFVGFLFLLKCFAVFLVNKLKGITCCKKNADDGKSNVDAKNKKKNL